MRRSWLLFGLLLLAACHAPSTATIRLPDARCDGSFCQSRLEAQHITFRFLDPPGALKPFTFRVETKGFTAPVEAVRVSFVMPEMDMGRNDYRLQKEPEGFTGRAVLPLCATGRHDWLAVVTLDAGTRRYEARFAFEAGAR